MNWLQKIAQTYTNIGHYIDPEDIDNPMFIAWYYKDGKIYDEVNIPHSDMDKNAPDIACGRIDLQTNRGSISFREIKGNRSLQKQIINMLVDKFPGVQFSVFTDYGPGIPLQQYWQSHIQEV